MIRYFIVLVMKDSSLAPNRSGPLPAAGGDFPAILVRAGAAACFAADEFFSAMISNAHTRRAYARAVGQFLSWCEAQDLELAQITPGQAGRFFNSLPGATATKNQALAALRRFFDALVTRHAVLLNPFHSVRGIKHEVLHGKTQELTIPQARTLIASLDTDRVVGLRDRALLGTLITTGARVGALCRLRRGDLRDQGDYRVLRFTEKGGKERDIPVRYDLDGWLSAYIEAAGIAGDPPASPLWRAGITRTGPLSDRPLTPAGVRQLLKRRLRAAGLSETLTPHSFRVMVVTDLLGQNVPIEEVQYLVGHSHPSTTQLYDRRQRRVTRNIVDRISF